MKKLGAVIFFFYFVNCVSSQSCPKRDEAAAKRDDSTRECRKACTSDADCSGLKKCRCDDLCGMSCYNPDAECDDISDFANGAVNYKDSSRKYNSRAVHSCSRGYKLQGQSVRRCRSNRKWSHTPPLCIRSCPDPGLRGNAFANDGLATVYPAGHAVVYKCKTGYRASGNGTVTCQPGYTWSSLGLLCIINDCGAPKETLNGDYTPKGKTTFGTRLTYTCNKGYQTRDSTIVICFASANWDKNPPTCSPVQCPPPPYSINNGKVIDTKGTGWHFGNKITFKCNEGYLINGSLAQHEDVCSAEGTWGAVPVCEPDLNANFNQPGSPGEGYTARSFNRASYTDINGHPDYGVFGDGVLQSPPYPISAGQSVCMEVRYKIDVSMNDALKAEAFYNGHKKHLCTFPLTNTWKTQKFLLQLAKDGDPEAQLQFSAKSGAYSWLDDIKVLDNSSCSDNPCSLDTTTTPATTTTTTTTTSTTTTELPPSSSTPPIGPKAGIPDTDTTTTKNPDLTENSEEPANNFPLWSIAVIIVGVGAVAGAFFVAYKYFHNKTKAAPYTAPLNVVPDKPASPNGGGIEAGKPTSPSGGGSAAAAAVV